MNSEDNLLNRRRNGLPAFKNECYAVLVDFAEMLELKNPEMIIKTPHSFLSVISDYLKNQQIEEEDKSWISARVGYFIGELLIEEFQGVWYLDENESSKNYCKYVVGKFNGQVSYDSVDAFTYAIDYINQPVGRDLSKEVVKIFDTVRR